MTTTTPIQQKLDLKDLMKQPNGFLFDFMCSSLTKLGQFCWAGYTVSKLTCQLVKKIVVTLVPAAIEVNKKICTNILIPAVVKQFQVTKYVINKEIQMTKEVVNYTYETTSTIITFNLDLYSLIMTLAGKFLIPHEVNKIHMKEKVHYPLLEKLDSLKKIIYSDHVVKNMNRLRESFNLQLFATDNPMYIRKKMGELRRSKVNENTMFIGDLDEDKSEETTGDEKNDENEPDEEDFNLKKLLDVEEEEGLYGNRVRPKEDVKEINQREENRRRRIANFQEDQHEGDLLEGFDINIEEKAKELVEERKMEDADQTIIEKKNLNDEEKKIEDNEKSIEVGEGEKIKTQPRTRGLFDAVVIDKDEKEITKQEEEEKIRKDEEFRQKLDEKWEDVMDESEVKMQKADKNIMPIDTFKLDIIAREEELNKLLQEIKENQKPDLSNLTINDYVNYTVTIYTYPYLNCVCNYFNYVSKYFSWPLKFSRLCPDLKYLNDKNTFHQVQYRIHVPTLQNLSMETNMLLNNLYDHFHTKFTRRKLTPRERNFYFGKYAMNIISETLRTHKEYSYNSINMNVLCMFVVYEWFRSQHLQLPFMDLVNDVTDENMQIAVDKFFWQPVWYQHPIECLRSYIRNWFYNQFPFPTSSVGSNTQEN